MKAKKPPLTSSFKLMAQVNIKLVLDAVYQTGKISRAELARRTRLQPATVGNVVATLLRERLLTETDEVDRNASGVGRPARILRLNDKARLVLAVDLEPDRLRIALVSLTLEVIAYSEYNLDRFSRKETILSQIISGCESILSANDGWKSKVIGMGLSLPGEVDIENGISRGSTNMPNWHDVNVVAELGDALELPVKIGKSMQMAALLEKWRRPEIRDKNVLCLILRTGVGVALLNKGSLYHGAANLDGEIGHTTVEIDGKKCECGKCGCLETYISSKAIRQRAVDMIEQGRAVKLLTTAGEDQSLITPEMIYRLAQKGDSDCVEIVRDIAKYLGLGVANLVQVLNPHEVVICGTIDLAEELIVEEIESVFDKELLPKTRASVKVLLSPYKGRAALLGSAVMVLDELFSLPEMNLPAMVKIRKTNHRVESPENDNDAVASA